MSLSNDLISQFVKVTNDDKTPKKETVVYGTVVEKTDLVQYVQLDGATEKTPVTSTVDNKAGDRVIVMIKDHKATVTGNLSDPSAKSTDVNQVKQTVDNLDLSGTNLRLNALEVSDVLINNELIAAKAEINSLKTNKLDAVTANLTYATIESLNVERGKITSLTSDVANIDALIFGSASGNVIQTSFANAVIAQLGDAQIKSAMVESVAASKITAGDIITNNVRVKSQNGLLLISDETIQINDGTRARVQIGKDASNDYSINIWDASGNLMFSKGGITDSAIKQAIIRNDMVSDTANIAAHKLDIDSLFDEINDSTNTIKSTKVYFDDKKQTLDVAFKSLSTTVTDQGEVISSQGTAISTIQGQLSSKIWLQDINSATGDMSTQYSSLEQNLNGFKTTVSETYATKIEVDTAQSTANNAEEKASNAQTLITQLSESISTLVTDGNGTSLMTQTEEGWTFSTAAIQSSVNDISEALDSLTTEVGDVGSSVDILQQAVKDLGEIAEYVYITTYENEPCIELGETDSEFKLRITNTRMMFSEGSTILAYFTNQAFNSKKVVIEEELQQGEFVWKVRSNGNLGLTWKGGAS